MIITIKQQKAIKKKPHDQKQTKRKQHNQKREKKTIVTSTTSNKRRLKSLMAMT
jgi:hypothetical protein